MKDFILKLKDKFIEVLPKSHVENFSEEFNNIIIDGSPLTQLFYFDAKDFFDLVIESNKDFVNFVFIQEEGKFKILIHLSNQRNSAEIDDQLYYLDLNKTQVEKQKFDVDIRDYLSKRKEYKEGLGYKIYKVTGVEVTEVISYKAKDILLFYVKHSKINYSRLEFRMIQFKIWNVGSDSYYTEKNNQISFVVRALAEENTEYFNFGHRIP
jgi:hypothetical protein